MSTIEFTLFVAIGFLSPKSCTSDCLFRCYCLSELMKFD